MNASQPASQITIYYEGIFFLPDSMRLYAYSENKTEMENNDSISSRLPVLHTDIYLSWRFFSSCFVISKQRVVFRTCTLAHMVSPLFLQMPSRLHNIYSNHLLGNHRVIISKRLMEI